MDLGIGSIDTEEIIVLNDDISDISTMIAAAEECFESWDGKSEASKGPGQASLYTLEECQNWHPGKDSRAGAQSSLF